MGAEGRKPIREARHTTDGTLVRLSHASKACDRVSLRYYAEPALPSTAAPLGIVGAEAREKAFLCCPAVKGVSPSLCGDESSAMRKDLRDKRSPGTGPLFGLQGH